MQVSNQNQEGIVFNIQKFSVNDGPGIRTVVFLKGCPLRCKWCANPESQLPKQQILYDAKKCVHCHHCADICPTSAITFQNDEYQINHITCSSCMQCVQECPQHALTFEGEKKTVQEVIDVVLQDEVFYEESGGGMTLSGGEFLSQPDFSRELLKAAKDHQINTCCETTGYTSTEVFQSLLPYLDTVLFDVKHWDEQFHIEGTGVSNKLILENLAEAIRQKKNVLPRLPIIPGFNNSLEDAENFVKVLQQVGATRIQLLPFHQFGENKYHLLGKEYAYEDVPALHKEDLESFQKIFIDHGIDAFF